MFSRALRYNQPAADLMLQVLNITNKTSFVKEQLTFGLPTVVHDSVPNISPVQTNDYDLQRPPEGTLTRITVTPTPESGFTKCQELLYRRVVIQDHFIAVPFVVYAKDRTREVILAALKEQYGLYLDDDMVDVSFRQVDLQSVIYRQHLGSVVVDEFSDYFPPASYNAIVTILPNHPYWIGELNVYIREAVEFLDRDIKNTLEIYKYLGHGDHNKIPAEMMLKMDGFVDKDEYIKNLKVGDPVGPMILDVVKSLTPDPWVFVNEPANFNLYGTKVIYNGHNTGDVYINDPRVTRVMIIAFGEEHCSNIRGEWVFGYYDSETWLRRQRIDALPIQDQ